MVATQDLIAAYLGRLRELASHANHIDRFHLFMDDEQLAEMEDALEAPAEQAAFYEALLAQYRQWRDEMSVEQWQAVVAHNDALNGANQNGLLNELT